MLQPHFPFDNHHPTTPPGGLTGRNFAVGAPWVSSINYTFPNWFNFGFLSSDYFLLQTFLISIWMPNKIHQRHNQLNLHDLVIHAMILCFRPFILLQHEELLRISINLIRSHRDCLYLHYLLCANPMHWWRSTRLVVVVMSPHRLIMIISISMMLDLKRRNENVKAEYTLNHTSGNRFGVILKIFNKNNLMQCDLVYYRPRSHNHKARRWLGKLLVWMIMRLRTRMMLK